MINSKKEEKSFFNLFAYCNLEDGANDALYIYEQCTILRDVILPSGDKLVKDTNYEQVNFLFSTGEFVFITFWIHHKGSVSSTPGKGFFTIRQVDLAPYMVWWDKDLPSL